jgi:acyl-coenzyme A thioesterase PaaI-like protein
MEITHLPFNRFIGVARAQTDGAVLSLPRDERYGNHLGTVHAGALLAVAEATSGEYLLRTFSDVGFPVVPVVRRVEAKFRKPAHGAVHTRWNVTPEAAAEFRTALTAKGRALIEVPVDVFDEQGAHTLAATFEWFVARHE